MAWRARGDHYYRLARRMGYRSRAAFKLKEAIERFRLLRPGDVVVDLGCAPGGWLQVAREAVGPEGFVLGVDIVPVRPLGFDNLKVLVADVLDPGIVDLIRAELPGGSADVLLSDMAPKASGVRELDHARQVDLAGRALEVARRVLKPGGRALVKASQGPLLAELVSEFRRAFRSVRTFKPKASRPESPEVYLVGLFLHA